MVYDRYNSLPLEAAYLILGALRANVVDWNDKYNCNDKNQYGIYAIGSQTTNKPVSDSYGILIVIGVPISEYQVQFACINNAIHYRRMTSSSYNGVSWKAL